MMVMVMMKMTAVPLYTVRDAWLFPTGSLHVAASYMRLEGGERESHHRSKICKPQVRNAF